MASENNNLPTINTNIYTKNATTAAVESNTSVSPVHVDTPALFDITTFPNASMIKIDTTSKNVKKYVAPTAQLRALDNIPQQIEIIPETDITICIESPKPIRYTYLNPSHRHKILRVIAMCLATITALLLFVAILIDDTANGEYCIEGNCGVYKCHWTGMTFDDGNNSSAYTKEYGAAFVSFCCIILSILFLIIGILYVQPFKILKRVCIPMQFARMIFVVSFILLLTSVIVFVFGDTMCYANTGMDIHFMLGPSIILDILGVSFVFFVLFIAL